MKNARYTKVIGTGGIGTGLLFITEDNQTLGRNESRLVRLSGAKDYCKQHIVLYYTSVLLTGAAAVYPIGCVGRDAVGEELLQEMKHSGMRVDYVARDEQLPTTISFCLQYPNKDGCNITASNGASESVTPLGVRMAMNEIGVDDHTLLAVIPEVSVSTRMEMLRYGSQYGAFCALSIPEAEAETFTQAGAFQFTNFLAVNEREALALAPGDGNHGALVRRLYEKLVAFNAGVGLLVTCGKDGAYTAQDGIFERIPTLPVDAVNTTGAGDAFLGGTLAGLCMGLPLQKGCDDQRFGESELQSAAELGALCAGMAVESMDSIAYNVHRSGILARIQSQQWQQSEAFATCLA
jgi:sugar/nucleoside kinase (ribokinase family)